MPILVQALFKGDNSFEFIKPNIRNRIEIDIKIKFIISCLKKK